MKKVAFLEDDYECLSIAESMIEEIASIKGKIGSSSAERETRDNFKKMLMKKVKMVRAIDSFEHW